MVDVNLPLSNIPNLSIDWLTKLIEEIWTPETLYVKQYTHPALPPLTPSTFATLNDTAKQRIILRGVNLPLLDNWEYPHNQSASSIFAEIEKTQANAVRIQWYKDYNTATLNTGRSAYDHDLTNALTACIANHMIPILMLGDLTAKDGDKDQLGELVNWWVSHGAILNQFKKHLIINIANEFGHYRWRGSDPAALARYREAYKLAITALRSAGLDMPIMIDAPDGGSSVDVFTQIDPATGLTVGQDFLEHDPKRNILLSVHSYWAAMPYNAIDMSVQALESGLPIVFGEIANKQDEVVKIVNEKGEEEHKTEYCYYDLDGTNTRNPPKNFPDGTVYKYQDLLARLNLNQCGWLAWSWHKDRCSARELTSDGNFTSLTLYGNDIVNHPLHGLANDNFYFRTRRSSTL